MQRNKKVWPVHRKKLRNKQKLFFEGAQTLDLLNKNFKSNLLNMFKRLMEEICK